MIDFRYHLISLIGVILALALGILAGSGFLGGPLLEAIKKDVQELRATNSTLRQENAELSDRLEQDESFARLADQYLTADQLQGRRIVMFQFNGSDGALIDGIKRGLTAAGAEITTEVTISDKFELTSQPARDELALAIGSVASGENELRLETATLLGERVAAAAVERAASESSSSPAAERAGSLVEALERAEFIGVTGIDPNVLVPTDAAFVIAGGGTERLGYEPAGFAVALAEGLAELAGPVIAVESQASAWGIVQAVRADVEARSVVSSVDNGNTTVGRIATILGLHRATRGEVGHYGFEPGRTAVIPAASPEN